MLPSCTVNEIKQFSSDSTLPVLIKHTSTVRLTANLSFTSSGWRPTVWLRSQQQSAICSVPLSTTKSPPLRYLPSSFYFFFVFCLLLLLQYCCSRPYADSRLQLLATVKNNTSKSPRDQFRELHGYRYSFPISTHHRKKLSLSLLVTVYTVVTATQHQVNGKGQFCRCQNSVTVICHCCVGAHAVSYANNMTNKMKKRSERRKHCALAVVGRSQTFLPRRRPPSRGHRTAKI